MAKRDLNVMDDEALNRVGLPPRNEWTGKDWGAFLDGWSCQRIGSPTMTADPALGGFFGQGKHEAAWAADRPRAGAS